MALWQVNFFVLPKEGVDANEPFKLSKDDDFDDSAYWKSRNVSPGFFEPIDKILPRGKSWADYLILYGNENSHRIDVIVENDIVQAVSLRIDFTTPFEAVLSELIEFFILNGLILIDEGLNVMPLNFESIKTAIENSPQIKTYKTLSDG